MVVVGVCVVGGRTCMVGGEMSGGHAWQAGLTQFLINREPQINS